MKLLLVASLVFGTPATWAQTAPTVAVLYRYCALLANENYFSLPNRLLLDYGQDVKGAPNDLEMAEMAENISGSRSVIDALNYLSQQGWELLSVTNVPSSVNESGTYSN